MYVEKNCLCCAGSDFNEFGGLVAPFISSYILNEAPRPTLLLECRSCGFRFFQERFTEDETARLYEGYRSDEYSQVRRAYEPWYTKAMNDDLGGDSAKIAFRKRLTAAFINDYSRGPAAASVLDWGGDRGQFIPDGFGDKYVFDISGVQPLDGVVGIKKENELDCLRFDLVMLAHVLEHLPDPRFALVKMHQRLTSEGLLFVEVPYERYEVRFSKRTRGFMAYLKLVAAQPRRVLAALDFLSSGFRVLFGFVPPLGFMKLHEHINFFNETSLSELLEASGYRVLGCRRAPEAKSVFGFQGVLMALAQPRLKEAMQLPL